jgi:hypothetical protein
MNSENIVDISKITHDINNNKYTDDFNKKYIAEEYNDKLEDIKNNQETFYVYVTGIADWGNRLDETKKDNVFYAWIRNNFRDHIISLIPTRFTKIKIRYYDPLSDTWKKETLKEYIEYLDETLIKGDNKNARLNSKFYKDYFPIEIISKTKNKSYIVLDLAHAFNPSRKGYVILDEGGNVNKHEKKDEFKIILLYPQLYLGNLPKGEYFEYFRVNPDNTVITYYDKLFDKNIKISDFNDSNSKDVIDDKSNKLFQIMYKINPKINNKNSNSYFKISQFPIEYNNKNIEDIIINIHLKHLGSNIYNIKKLMWDALWDDTTTDIFSKLPKISTALQTTIDGEIEVELNKLRKPEFKKP